MNYMKEKVLLFIAVVRRTMERGVRPLSVSRGPSRNCGSATARHYNEEQLETRDAETVRKTPERARLYDYHSQVGQPASSPFLFFFFFLILFSLFQRVLFCFIPCFESPFVFIHAVRA